MKIQIQDNQVFTASLLNGKGAPRVEVAYKDGVTPTRLLGPHDFVFEASKGQKASELVRYFGIIHDGNRMKPAVKAVVDKFLDLANTTKTPEQIEQQAEREKQQKLSAAALELFEASSALDMIRTSDVMTCSDEGLNYENVRQLCNAIDFVSRSIIKNSRIVNDIVNE